MKKRILAVILSFAMAASLGVVAAPSTAKAATGDFFSNYNGDAYREGDKIDEPYLRVTTPEGGTRTGSGRNVKVGDSISIVYNDNDKGLFVTNGSDIKGSISASAAGVRIQWFRSKFAGSVDEWEPVYGATRGSYNTSSRDVGRALCAALWLEADSDDTVDDLGKDLELTNLPDAATLKTARRGGAANANVLLIRTAVVERNNASAEAFAISRARIWSGEDMVKIGNTFVVSAAQVKSAPTFLFSPTSGYSTTELWGRTDADMAGGASDPVTWIAKRQGTSGTTDTYYEGQGQFTTGIYDIYVQTTDAGTLYNAQAPAEIMTNYNLVVVPDRSEVAGGYSPVLVALSLSGGDLSSQAASRAGFAQVNVTNQVTKNVERIAYKSVIGRTEQFDLPTLENKTESGVTKYFAGWSTTPNGVKVSADKNIIANYTSTYYAIWNSTKPEVTNGGKVFRLLNKGTGEHLYTANAGEAVILQTMGWIEETSPGNSYGTSGVAVYRLFNSKTGEHLYTPNTGEASILVNQYGWKYDNNAAPIFYGNPNGTTPVYRLFNRRLKAIASHHYTSSLGEISDLITKYGWTYDNNGVALWKFN